MSTLTAELNLVQGQDDDDTADYLTIDLANSLAILDGLFSQTGGHNHNGAHQGGNIQPLDFTVGEDLTVIGASELQGPVHAHAALTVDGLLTTTADLTVGQDLTVTRDLTVSRNETVAGTLTVTGAASADSLTTTADLSVGGVLFVPRVAINGFSLGTFPLAVGGNGIAQGFFYQRNNSAARCWDAIDFGISINNVPSAAVIRDGNGAIVDPKITGQPDMGPGPYTFPTVTGNAGLWRYIKAWGGARVMNLTNGTLIFENTQYTSGQYTLKQGDSFTCYCDGANWWVL
jgi:hypothetical protein